ncbi:hypothetical protein ACP4OV_028086 [Aristida adscensionis]
MASPSTSASSSAPPPPPPPRWVILDRAARARLAEEEEEEDDGDDDDAGCVATLAEPPRVSTVVVPARAHPDHPLQLDERPYVVAADPEAGILLNLARGPLTGIRMALSPELASTLLLVRDFLPAASSAQRNAVTGRSVVRVPARVYDAKRIGLVSVPGTGGADFFVAELRVDAGVSHARLSSFRSGAARWTERHLPRPAMPGKTTAFWGWDTDDVVAHGAKLYWVNLRRGLLSCSLRDGAKPLLQLDELPEAIREEDQHRSGRAVEADRCVRLSKGRVRYVEITREASDSAPATLVVMWTLMVDADGSTSWRIRYGTPLGQLWMADSYKATGMPEEVPVLAVVNPTNPDVVFFFLQNFLFGVLVPEVRVIGCINHPLKLEEALNPLRYLHVWELPSHLSQGPPPVLDMFRDRAAELRRTQFALTIRENALNRLEESLLEHTKKDDTWNRNQILLMGALVTGLTVLYNIWPWLPSHHVRDIAIVFGLLWVLGSCFVPCALFGKRGFEKCFAHQAARIGLISLTVLVLYGLYRMCLMPSPGKDAPAPTAADSATNLVSLEHIFLVLLGVSLVGHILSWILGAGRTSRRNAYNILDRQYLAKIRGALISISLECCSFDSIQQLPPELLQFCLYSGALNMRAMVP